VAVPDSLLCKVNEADNETPSARVSFAPGDTVTLLYVLFASTVKVTPFATVTSQVGQSATADALVFVDIGIDIVPPIDNPFVPAEAE
jgi:hypothetical protein